MAKDTWEHPENDLHSDADYANRYREAPRDFDELADSPDPAVVDALNKRSTKQAVWYTVAVVVGTVVVGFLLAIPARLSGGEFCDAGTATWFCSRSSQIWWPFASSVIPVAGLLGCAFIMNHKLKNYIRWRPWMGAFWVLVPWSMLWMTQVFQIAITGGN